MRPHSEPDPGSEEPQRWVLVLYVSGASPRSGEAVEAVRQLCDTELPGQVELRIVDVNDQPALVLEDRIMAAPTLVREVPLPLRKLVGNLTDPGRVRAGLQLYYGDARLDQTLLHRLEPERMEQSPRGPAGDSDGSDDG